MENEYLKQDNKKLDDENIAVKELLILYPLVLSFISRAEAMEKRLRVDLTKYQDENVASHEELIMKQDEL
jgi:hypothetical protein